MTVGILAPIALLADGCRTATQVTLVLSTDALCSDLKAVDIIIAGDAQAAEGRAMPRSSSTSTSACADGRIGTLVVTPSGDGGAVVVIAGFKKQASACLPPSYDGCIVARRRFSFIEHVGTTLPILLEASCVDVPCSATSTCSGSRCVDSRVDCRSDGSCGEPGRAEDGGVIVVDGSVQDAQVPPVDSGVDATVEAGIDAGVDAGTGDGGLTKAPFGSCPVVAACPLGGGATVCGGDPPVGCCNDGMSPGAPRCEKMTGCSTGFVACCGRQGDCPVGTACCASTQSATLGTMVACGTPSECAVFNPYICRTQGAVGPPECPPGKQCGLQFGPPGYFSCQ